MERVDCGSTRSATGSPDRRQAARVWHISGEEGEEQASAELGEHGRPSGGRVAKVRHLSCEEKGWGQSLAGRADHVICAAMCSRKNNRVPDTSTTHRAEEEGTADHSQRTHATYIASSIQRQLTSPLTAAETPTLHSVRKTRSRRRGLYARHGTLFSVPDRPSAGVPPPSNPPPRALSLELPPRLTTPKRRPQFHGILVFAAPNALPDSSDGKWYVYRCRPVGERELGVLPRRVQGSSMQGLRLVRRPTLPTTILEHPSASATRRFFCRYNVCFFQ